MRTGLKETVAGYIRSKKIIDASNEYSQDELNKAQKAFNCFADALRYSYQSEDVADEMEKQKFI